MLTCAFGQTKKDSVQTYALNKQYAIQTAITLFHDDQYFVITDKKTIEKYLRKRKDRLIQNAYDELSKNNSTDLYTICVKNKVIPDLNQMTSELIQKNKCSVIKKNSNIYVQKIIAKDYSSFDTQNIKYYIDDHYLFEYFYRIF